MWGGTPSLNTHERDRLASPSGRPTSGPNLGVWLKDAGYRLPKQKLTENDSPYQNKYCSPFSKNVHADSQTERLVEINNFSVCLAATRLLSNLRHSQ